MIYDIQRFNGQHGPDSIVHLLLFERRYTFYLNDVFYMYLTLCVNVLKGRVTSFIYRMPTENVFTIIMFITLLVEQTKHDA